MVRQKISRLSLLFAAVISVFTGVIEPNRFSDVKIDSRGPCLKMASVMLQHVDTIGYPAKLACLGDATIRHAGAGLTEYMHAADTDAYKDEAQGVWAAAAPEQHYTSFKHGNAAANEFPDIAVSGDGNLIAVAGGTQGLFVYNKNMELLKHFNLIELGTGNGLTTNPTDITTVSFHPIRPWLALGTANTTAGEIVTTLNLEDINPANWPATLTAQADMSAGLATPVISVRFSPDGLFLAGSSAAALFIAELDDPQTFISWLAAAGEFAALPTVTSTTGHVSWSGDSQKLAMITTVGATGEVGVASKYAAAVDQVGSGLTAALTFSTPTGVAFNSNGKKLAVTTATTLEVVDATGVDATMWDVFKDNAGSGFTITASGTPSLSNVIFHPSVDIVAAADAGTTTADLRVFDVRNAKTQDAAGNDVWAEVSTGIFPYTASTSAVAANGLAWNKFGTGLFLGTVGNATLYPELVNIDTHNDDPDAWAVAQTLEYHTEDVNVVAASPVGNLLATAENATAVGQQIIKIWDTSNDTQVLLGGVDSILATDTVDAMAFSPDGKYLFTAGDGAGPVRQLRVYDVTDPSTPSLVGSAEDTAVDVAVNSLAVTKLRINNGTPLDALYEDEIYFVAAGLELSAAGTSVIIDFRAFDGTALSTTNLAVTATNGFGEHTVLTPTEPVHVAMRGSRLVTASAYNNTTDGANRPEVKVWNVQTFVNAMNTDINTVPVSVQAPIATLNKESTNLGTPGTNWHADAVAITTVDITPDGNLIATGDSGHDIYLTNILTLTTPTNVQKTGSAFTGLNQVKFSPNAKFASTATPTTTTVPGSLRDGYLGVALSTSQTVGTFVPVGNLIMYDLATDLAASILSQPVQSNNLLLDTGTNSLESFDWGRKGYKVYGGGDNGVITRYHINTAVAAMAQNLANHYNAAKGVSDQAVAEEVVKDMARLSGLDIDGSADVLEDVEDAISDALTYLSNNTGDVFGVARTMQRSFERASDIDLHNADPATNPDDLDLAFIAANRYATWSGQTFEKEHLFYPPTLAVECGDKLDLSREHTQAYANKIYRYLRQYGGFDVVSNGIDTNSQLVFQASQQPQNRAFTALSAVADEKGVDSAQYFAELAYPDRDLTRGVGKQLAIAASDYVSEHSASDSATLGREASKSVTDALRGLRKQHVEDLMCRSAAAHANNYIKFGKQLMDWMGIGSVDKSGVLMDAVIDAAWAQDLDHQDQYLFIAAGTHGLLVFDRDYNFIKQFLPADLGGQTEAGAATRVESVSTHPSKPWLAIGTDEPTTRENVVVLDFTSNDPSDWLKTKITIPDASSVPSDPAVSVRFSPDGNHLVAAFAAAAGTMFAVDVTDTLEQWSTSTVFTGLPTSDPATTGHISWKADSSAFVVVKNATTVALSQGTTTADYTAGLTAPTGVSFNHDGTKLAVTDESSLIILNTATTGATAAATVALWSVSKTLSPSAKVDGNTPLLKSPLFHPEFDVVVVGDQETIINTTGGGSPDANAQDVRVFDLRNASSSKWFEYDSAKYGGEFPFIMSTSKLSDDNGADDTMSFGMAWNSLGTKLAIGSNRLALRDTKADLVVFATNTTSAGKWDFDRATFCYSDGYRLSIDVFNDLETGPTTAANVTAAETSLIGDLATAASTPAAIFAAVNALDLTKNVPFELTKAARRDAEAPTADFAAAAPTSVDSAAAAAAVVGSGYAYAHDGTTLVATDIVAVAATETLVQSLLVREDIGTNTGATLPLGSFHALRGDRLNPNFYGSAGTFSETANNAGDNNGPGPDKSGTAGAGEWGATDSTLHGPFNTLGSYLDALYNDVMHPVNGLIANVTTYASLPKNQKEVIGRAIVLRTLLSGDESLTRDYFDGTTTAGIPALIAALVGEVMTNSFSTYTAPTATTSITFAALNESVRQEIAAVAILFGDETEFDFGTTAESVVRLNAVLNGAFLAATYIPEPTTIASKNIAIQKEMALLGGLGVVAAISNAPALVVTAGAKDDASQIGRELARGLLSGAQIKGLAVEDFGSTGQDGICVDLSENLLAAVVGVIALELQATVQDMSAGAGSGANTEANIGSFAAGLAYNQFFRTDSMARAIAKLTREYHDATHGVDVQNFSLTSALYIAGAPTVTGGADAIASVAASGFGEENLSRARYQVARIFEVNMPINSNTTADLGTVGAPIGLQEPNVTLPVAAVIGHVGNIMTHPTTFDLNVNRVPLASNFTEPIGGAPFATPQQMVHDYAFGFAGLTDSIATNVAQDVFSTLCDPCNYEQVDAAGEHCDGLYPPC